MYKLQVQDDPDNPGSWHDVMGPDGALLTFSKEDDARRKLEQLYPVLTRAEQLDVATMLALCEAVRRRAPDWHL